MKKKLKNKQSNIKTKNNKEKDCHFNNLFESSPKNLKYFEDLPIRVENCVYMDNGICLFKSIDDLIVLSYFKTYFGKTRIFFYNIIDKKLINKITGLKGETIYINHFLDNIQKRDLLLQIVCGYDYEPINDIYIWNFNNLECVLYIEKIYEKGLIYSASLLKENNIFYVIASNNKGKNLSQPLKVYDFFGNKVKEINTIKKNINDLIIYYDKKLKKNFIVITDYKSLSSYDYNTNKLYKKYYDKIYTIDGETIVINGEKNPVKIIECDFNGYIRIFNFHTGDLLFQDKGKDNGLCYWNDNYLFVSESYNRFALINISSPKIKHYYSKHKDSVFKIIKLIHPKYGESLITFDKYSTKFWIIKK